MPLSSYREPDVWNAAIATACSIYPLTSRFPSVERYVLSAQMRRAAVSIPANIAEGYGRSTRGEYLNQISVAVGSANELDTLCVLSRMLNMPPPRRSPGSSSKSAMCRRC